MWSKDGKGTLHLIAYQSLCVPACRSDFGPKIPLRREAADHKSILAREEPKDLIERGGDNLPALAFRRRNLAWEALGYLDTRHIFSAMAVD